MFMRKHALTFKKNPFFWMAWLLGVGLMAVAPRPATAADDPGHGATPVKPVLAKPAAPQAQAAPAAPAAPASTTPKAAAPAAGGGDPMDTLREKLAARLGATKAPDTKSPYVVRVSTKVGEHGEGVAGAGPGHSAPPAKAAAAHRAGKPRAALAPAAGAKTHPLLADPHAGHDLHWSYQGAGGPEAWGQLKPEFATCTTGKRQSPIDIRGGVKVELEPVHFDYRPTGFAVVDNGHTVQVNMGPGNAIEVMGRRYDLLQFHFHRPSEERIDGRQFDMVAHLVHKDPEGRLAVVAVLLDRGSAHPLVQTVWNNLPLEKGDELRASVALDLNGLLPQDRRYYTYMGSLTTPPCSEGVLWMVMAQPVGISNDQIAVFSRLYPMNARPVQQAAGRLIKQSH
jgi:carbonic anhydrase